MTEVAKRKFPGQRYVGGKKGARKPSQLLKDLRAVYRQEESLDASPGQRALRVLFKERPQEFLQHLQRAEQVHRMGGSKQAAGGKVEEKPVVQGEADEGQGRVEELIERLLSEWSDEQSR